MSALALLARYPVAVLGCTPLGNHGGYSGAGLWRVETDAGSCCLKAWPPEFAASRLAWIHQQMRHARAAGFPFVPHVHSDRHGETVIENDGRCWELTQWMPGRADFRQRPEPARLRAACTALARLHQTWQTSPRSGPCPAVRRRVAKATAWTALVQSGWQPHLVPGADPVCPWAERAWQLLCGRIEQIPRQLSAWTVWPAPLQPCLCDIWHDHILFEGDRVSGLIDYGGMKIDHVAVDLARLLGSMAGDDAALRVAGLQAYTAVRPLTWDEERLTTLLDQTGTLIAAANWLVWLYRERRVYEDRAAVARRLADLVKRLESPHVA